MSASFHFSFEPDWHRSPLAFWVHVPLPGHPQQFEPPAPLPIPHRGYACLRVQFGQHDLQFTSPAQLDHFIEVLATRPLPTSRQLSARRGSSYGPNGHWLSRLPAQLKSPRQREQLVRALRDVRARVVGPGPNPAFLS